MYAKTLTKIIVPLWIILLMNLNLDLTLKSIEIVWNMTTTKALWKVVLFSKALFLMFFTSIISKWMLESILKNLTMSQLIAKLWRPLIKSAKFKMIKQNSNLWCLSWGFLRDLPFKTRKLTAKALSAKYR